MQIEKIANWKIDKFKNEKNYKIFQVFENEDAIGPCIQGEGGTRLCPEGPKILKIIKNNFLGYACVGEGEGECRRIGKLNKKIKTQ